MPKIGRKLLVLKFEDPDFEGIEVRIRSLSMGAALDLSDEAEAARSGAGLDKVSRLLDQFIDKLESWNIEDDNGPVPATREGLLSMDLSDGMYLLYSWFDAMTAVGDDLGKGSNSGQPSREESLPMEALSPSHLNYPVHG